MTTYVAFLRAVNVGRRAYPMAELRAALTAAGFEDVETHIQTGNVRFSTSMRSRERITEALEAAMRADRGFEVRVVLMTPAELTEVHTEALELEQGRDVTGHYVALLARPAYAKDIALLEARSTEGEEVRVGERAVHLIHTGVKFHEARTGNAEVERHLGVATTRNLTVITKLTEKWGA
jgi:uncharacterized protein (DUF1697 family)